MTEIRLYLGAHKTATTHLQGILIANRERLALKGVHLAAPPDVRKEWMPLFFQATRKLRQSGAIPQELLLDLRKIIPKTGNLILTEENILGVSDGLIKKPGIYPNAPYRLKALRKIFSGCDMSLYFSLRSYDGFWRSMYSETVRTQGFLPWSDFYNPETFDGRKWQETVLDFRSALPKSKITLWRFEDFRAVMPLVLMKLTEESDVAPLIAAYKSDATRTSLSQKTVDILSEVVPALGREAAQQWTRSINKHYSLEAGYPAFSPFNDAESAEMRARYTKDIEYIRRRFPKITFLEPSPD